jgi:SPP1 family predicted phage head-tail adaptor
MRAGRLSKRVALQRYSEAADGYGEQVRTWSTFATVWAGIEPLAAKERFAAQQINAHLTLRCVIRYRSDVDTTCRVIFDDRIFQVDGVIDPNMQHAELTLLCQELL